MFEHKVWNETIANLSLMALGSSAPEILLNVLQTGFAISESPPELGPSTIVGSAAFNLLVISGCSIIAVGTQTDPSYKHVDQVAVFGVTSIFSLFAYIWMFFVLSVNSPEKVELWEAIVTLVFFVILLTVSYGTDRLNTYLKEVDEDAAE